MGQKNQIEKRQHPRIEQNISLKISSGEVDFVTETRNLSCSGVYCRVNKYVEPMTRLALTLLLPQKKGSATVSKKIVCHGVVVRTENIPYENAFNLAIFFSDIRIQDKSIISAFVTTTLEAQKASVH